MEEQYDMVVDRLFDAARYGVQSSLNTQGFTINDKLPKNKHIDIKSKDGIKIVRLPGSGDPLCEVKIGIKDVNWYNGDD